MLTVSLVLLLLSLLPVQSLNCLHGPFNNSTKASCPVSKRWCYSLQNVHSSEVIFANRGCDEKNMCERLKWVGREVVQLLPQLTLFTSYSFCFDAMNQSICCCDRDNCNTGLWMEPMKRPLTSSPSVSYQIISAIPLVLIFSLLV